jgi:hypothetical protein
MEQSYFLSKLKTHIDRTANAHDPQITANAIYFITKQYPVSVISKEAYRETLKKIRTHLVENFGWKMTEVHRCVCILHRLMKIF